MSPRNPDPWEEYRRDRDDISVAAAFFMTFALLGVVAWVVFFGTGWVVPSAASILPQAATRTPAAYVSTLTSSATLAQPAATTAPAKAVTTNAATAATTAAVSSAKMRVANTGGDGVYLRKTPGEADLWIPWPENAVVDSLNEQNQAGGRTYIKVRDPRGNVGWMPSDYLVPA